MDVVSHTLIAFGSVFVAYWFGLFHGYIRGNNEAVTEVGAMTCKRTLLWARSKYDINITDFEIEEVYEEIRKS